MDRPGHQLLAGAAFAGDQHRGIGRRHQGDPLEHLLHGGALAQQVFARRPRLPSAASAGVRPTWASARSITAAACSRSNGLAR